MMNPGGAYRVSVRRSRTRGIDLRVRVERAVELHPLMYEVEGVHRREVGSHGVERGNGDDLVGVHRVAPGRLRLNGVRRIRVGVDTDVAGAPHAVEVKNDEPAAGHRAGKDVRAGQRHAAYLTEDPRQPAERAVHLGVGAGRHRTGTTTTTPTRAARPTASTAGGNWTSPTSPSAACSWPAWSATWCRAGGPSREGAKVQGPDGRRRGIRGDWLPTRLSGPAARFW
jgi:hypothetical protein